MIAELMSSPIYSAHMAATYLGVSTTTIKRLVAAGRLAGSIHPVSTGRAYQISQDALDAFLAAGPYPASCPGYTVPGQSKQVLTPTAQERATGYPVLRAVCATFEMSRAVIEGPGRKPEIVEARRVAVWVLYHDRHMGVTGIGRLLRRHHATVLHALASTDPTEMQIDWGITEVRRILGREQVAS